MGRLEPLTISHNSEDALKRHAAFTFELCVMLVTIVLAAAYLVYPAIGERSPVGSDLPSWSIAWAMLYGAGAVIDIAGLVWRVTRIRVAGLVLVASGYLVEFTAGAYYGNPDARIVVYLIIAGACTLHARVLTLKLLADARHGL